MNYILIAILYVLVSYLGSSAFHHIDAYNFKFEKKKAKTAVKSPKLLK